MIFSETHRSDADIFQKVGEEQIYKDLVVRLVRRMPMSILKSMFPYAITEDQGHFEFKMRVLYDSEPIEDRSLIPPEEREQLAMIAAKYKHMDLFEFLRDIGS